MKYAQLYKTDVAGNISEQLGSDGVMILDGRWGNDRISIEVYYHARRLNNCLNKAIVGYKVWQGRSFTDSRPISDYKRIHP